MSKFALVLRLAIGAVGLTAVASGTPRFAVAHEGHKMACDETGINAMNMDIQAMNAGEAKTTAMKEMEMAEQMMAKNDTAACATHMHSAMEAMEK